MDSHDQCPIKKGIWVMGNTAIHNPYALANAIKLVIPFRRMGIYTAVENNRIIGNSH
jgi:hypothetical protein